MKKTEIKKTALRAAFPHTIPIMAGFVVLLHHRKRQMLLSIAGGTIVYMVLVQCVF